MNEDAKKIYLRVLSHLSEMLAIIECADKQEDEYPATMLRQLILREREALGLEEDRRREADKQRQIEIEQKREYNSE